MRSKIYPIEDAPIDELIVLFEQFSEPFVGYLDRKRRIRASTDHLEAENHDGPAEILDFFKEGDIVGWLPLPQARNNNWESIVKD